MARHSFIQMSKLSNVKGRISYITSHAKQENLYATYRTADNEFWSNLARESQQEFKRSGTEGKCIEARELIIALPEVYTRYEPQEVLEDFTEEFHRRYGVECVSALHHNKRKTNYHIHLIFSERKLLPEPDIKIATRSVFYDETGKRVRTKKEITGEDGQIRKGCTVIKKGEVYESHLFTVKDDKIKRRAPMSEKKRDAGYRAALTGAKGTVRLLIYVCVILVIILAAKTSYQFGHDVFAEEPVASRGKGKEVTVQVRSGMEAKELGELLKDNGLIDESLLVFEAQYRLSGYYGGIKDGSYVLNTAQTVDEMLEILAGVNTEGQPSAE